MRSAALLMVILCLGRRADGLRRPGRRADTAADPPVADGVVGPDRRLRRPADRGGAAAGDRQGPADADLRRQPEGQPRRHPRRHQGHAPLYDCCVDLGFSATDTVGNARETADWARGNDTAR